MFLKIEHSFLLGLPYHKFDLVQNFVLLRLDWLIKRCSNDLCRLQNDHLAVGVGVFGLVDVELVLCDDSPALFKVACLGHQ